MYKNKKILVLGMARSGYEVSKLLSKYNNKIIITDKKDQDINHIEELEELGVTFIKSEDPIDLIDIKKMVKNKYIDRDYVVSNKLTTGGIKNMYKEKGATCDI